MRSLSLLILASNYVGSSSVRKAAWLCAGPRFSALRVSRALGALLSGILLSAITSLSSTALGQERTVDAEVDVPEHCGSQEEFQAELVRLPGYDSENAPSIRVHILPKDASAFELQVMLSGQETRTFTDSNCLTLFRTAIVVAAASIPTPESSPPGEPKQAATTAEFPILPDTSQAPSTESAKATSTESAKAAPLQEKNEPDPTGDSQATQWRVAFGAGGGAAFGMSPQISPLVEAMGVLSVRRWGGSVALRYLPPTQKITAGEWGLRMQSFGFRTAAVFLPTKWLHAHAGLSIYGIVAQGIGVDIPESDLVWLTAAELELALSPLQIADFTLEFALQGRLGLNQPSFQMQPDIEVYEMPLWGAAALFRINWSPQ